MPEGIDNTKNKLQRLRIDRRTEQGNSYAIERDPHATEEDGGNTLTREEKLKCRDQDSVEPFRTRCSAKTFLQCRRRPVNRRDLGVRCLGK